MLASAIPSNWKKSLDPGFLTKLDQLEHFIGTEKKSGKVIFPTEDDIFRALKLTPLEDVKVVILGQDPYHGERQAHGLSFSVPSGERIPPSLRNIYKELASDLNIATPNHGDLSPWAKQGVLLLNAVLTVESGLAGSHAGKGWEQFTDGLIKTISDKKFNVVFLLWGNYALKKRALIDEQKHHVIASVHPSPLSASRGFFGSKPFSKINDYLTAHGNTPIDWRLSFK